MENLKKFSSCRGVAFEIKPHFNPFGITTTPIAATAPTRGSKSYWFPWVSSSKAFTYFNTTLRSLKRNSGHFCDLELEDEDDHEELSRNIKCMEDGHIQQELNQVSISKLPLVESKGEQNQKPNKPKESRLSIIMLFVACLGINIIFLLLSATGTFQYATNQAALFSIGNILALTLCRSKACLRVVFYFAVKVFGQSWVPLRVKTAITSLLQSLGGIHSGCGVSSIAWLIVLGLKPTRAVHFAGLPYLANLYDRVLVVATGSGTGIFLSLLLQPCAANVCLLWVARGIEQNFGKEIKEWVSGYPKDKVIIHDTAVLGRPNVSQMSVDAARNWRAEVVIVTGNPEGSRDIVNACKAAGIFAFGLI
ncbi:hypothetical protein RHMOL_Rhmol13G0136200 [Rhododendron molle]|uniref:Uncharacterized protein n=1 Tax=Rhododendron molle TaxID=49168 RepID=A0ACC0L6H9_RHOML|nr:hypothetical protein RHMOL_Rhmol13G0136200 [Rhododendron molle]